MTREETAAYAAQLSLVDQGFYVDNDFLSPSFRACDPADICYQFFATTCEEDELLDLLIVDPPKDLNGEQYLAIYAEGLDEVFFVPTDEIPSERFTLALTSKTTRTLLDAYRFVDLT